MATIGIISGVCCITTFTAGAFCCMITKQLNEIEESQNRKAARAHAAHAAALRALPRHQAPPPAVILTDGSSDDSDGSDASRSASPASSVISAVSITDMPPEAYYPASVQAAANPVLRKRGEPHFNYQE